MAAAQNDAEKKVCFENSDARDVPFQGELLSQLIVGRTHSYTTIVQFVYKRIRARIKQQFLLSTRRVNISRFSLYF